VARGTVGWEPPHNQAQPGKEIDDQVPTYGYRCTNGHEFDVWQRMTDEAKADCPECGCPGKRLFFPAGIVFKGSGFYKTDSRKSSGESSSSIPSPSTSTPASPSPSTSSSPSPSTSTPAKSTGKDSSSSSSTAAATAD
jgi:putative FmdB family regulatory protein